MINEIKSYVLPDEYRSDFNIHVFITLVTIAVSMLVIEYFGWQTPFHGLAYERGLYDSYSRNDLNFYAQLWTSVSFFIILVVVPFITHKAGKQNFGIGLSPRNFFINLKPYLIILAFMIPVVFTACLSPQFNQFYPLYRPPSFDDWMIFELIYMTQLFCVEFFFRGFGLFRLEKYMPGKAVFIMMLPYVLFHIHKPFPEAVGSIFAGLILGFLALKSKSIWPGVFTHCIVAFSADAFSLYHSGHFSRW